MEEFHGRLGETPHTWAEWSSSQLLQNTPLHPIAEWGRQRFGADPACRTALGRPREHSGSDRPGPNRIRAPARAVGRCPLARGPGSETRAGGVAPPATGGDDGMDSGVRADASSRACLRGPALGRPDFARSHARAGRARGAGAVADHRDGAAGVPPAVERARRIIA